MSERLKYIQSLKDQGMSRAEAIEPIPKNLEEVYSKLGVANNDQELLKILNAPLL